MLLGPLAPMQSCVEPRRHVTYRRCNSPAQVGAHLSRAVKDEEMSAVAEAHDASGLSGPNSSTAGGGSGSFYGSQQCCHPGSKKVDSLCSISRLGALAGSPSMYSKAALVWPPGPDTHVKSAGLAATASTAPVRPVSPSSGLVHWMSMMSDHAHVNVPSHSAPHEVHYMWNGVETKMNTSDQHNSPSLQKGPGNSLEEGRTGGMESSQMHGMYGNHGNRNNNNNSSSPPVSTPASSSSMLVVPQPVNAVVSKNTNLNVPGSGATTNGTGRKYQCKMCPQIFGSKADLQLHTQIHMREAKPYKCSQCSKAFANSSYLSQHTRIHLGIKPYRCEICQRKFTQLSHLQQHIRTHTGDKPYKCRHPGCNKAFSQLSNLQSHSRCHQTDKPYKCNSCYKCFADEASLLEHIPKHKESKHLKTHICQYCGKSYTQETYLAKHMQKHADRIEKRGAHPPVGSNVPNPAPSSRIPTSSENFWSAKSSAPAVSEGASLGDGTTTSGAAVSHHVHPHVSESCLQSNLVDHSRLHLASREVDHHRQHMCITSSSGMSNTTNSSSNSNTRDHTNDMSHSSHLVSAQGHYDTSNIATGTNKSTSAFTPIQAGMLPISSGTQMSMPGSSRSYFPYESFGFPKTTSQVTSMDVKPSHNTFPNQLIALHQIRNYASMPSITGGEHPITLKDKSQQ